MKIALITFTLLLAGFYRSSNQSQWAAVYGTVTKAAACGKTETWFDYRVKVVRFESRVEEKKKLEKEMQEQYPDCKVRVAYSGNETKAITLISYKKRSNPGFDPPCMITVYQVGLGKTMVEAHDNATKEKDTWGGSGAQAITLTSKNWN